MSNECFWLSVSMLNVEWTDFIHSLGHLAPLFLLQSHAKATMPLCQCLHERGESRVNKAIEG